MFECIPLSKVQTPGVYKVTVSVTYQDFETKIIHNVVAGQFHMNLTADMIQQANRLLGSTW